MGICILLAVLQLVSLNDGFDFSCPSKAHWKLRAKSMCKPPDNYTCLYDVTLQVNEYRDRCYRPRILASGYKYVFQPNLNRATCSLTRYQPIIFETIGNSDCIFLKSFCSSEGQMTYENGSPKSDRTCVCNSYKGFAFLNNTKNEIYCNPSNEDCSCYLGIQPNITTTGDLKNHDEINLHQNHSQGNFLSKSQAFKNNDLDNLKYNLACPTKKYRTVAVVCIMVSLVLYILIAMGIYNRQVITRTLTYTPKAFEIVDCTDHSITVEWNIHDLENCLEYELVYRREGSDEWKNRFLSEKDVTANDNGRYVYKLQNLSSDSSYELKLYSVDIHQVKSQPSRLQTRKTLKIALPQVIKQLPEDDRVRYIKLMEDSATERRYFTRIMIVGKEGVGKTCLLRRLLNESIEDVNSTDGVDIVVRQCKINIHDGEWTIEKDITDDNVHRMQKALAQIQSKENEKHEKFNTCHAIASNNGSGMDVQDGNQNNTINNVDTTDESNPNVHKVSTDANDTNNTMTNVDTTDESNTNVHKVSTDADDTNNTIDNEFTTDKSNPNVHKVSTDASDTKNTIETSVEINMKVNESEVNVKDNEYENITNTDADSTKSENEDNLSSLEMPQDLMSQIFTSTSTSSIPSNDYALCGLWDFAGQKDFYATHQVFLTSTAIYLVVADMETDIWKETEDDTKESTSTKQKNAHFLTDDGEYVDFWFDSIHCYRAASLSGQEPLNAPFDPPAIVVFTGTDRYEQENLNKRKQELEKQLFTVNGKQTKYQHFRKCFYLSNKQKSTEEFGKLRDTISAIAKNMENWGESVPLKWILLEQLIENNRKKGKNFVKFNDIVKLAKHREIEISDTDELKLFLRFQGKVGNIIYFEDITNLIILEPQWLVNAFRCLVSDKLDINALTDKSKPICSHWTEFQTTGKISNLLITTLFKLKGGDQALEQKEDLIKVMKKFDILVEIEGTNTYIMPSKMPSSNLKTVCKTNGVCTEYCERTSWFCLKFDFLPPVFFNHLSAWFIKQYQPFKLTDESNSLALYKEVCVFNFDNSGCDKLLMTMSTDTIALQVVSFDTKKKDVSDLCSNVRNNLENTIEDIKQRYSVEVLYVQRFKCSEGSNESNAISLEDLKAKDSFYCLFHKYAHESKMLYLPWTKHERKMNDAQQNGDGIFDMLCNVENLKEEEVLPKMQEIAAAFKAMEDYDRGKGLKLVKSIAETFTSRSTMRKKIGHVIHQQQFAETAMKMLTSIDIKGIFITEENKETVLHTLSALLNFSDASLELAKSVAQHGGVKYLTDICNHKPYTDDLSSEDVLKVIDYSLGILHNIARNANVHHYFKENTTSDVMIKYLQSKEEHALLKITAMLTLAHIVEVEENDKLTDNTEAVEGIVSYIKLALDTKRRRYKGFTPIELMDGLDKLAVNDINKRKIVDAGALPILLRILKQDNIEEQAVASKALWTLSFDKDVAQKIRDFANLMPTLEKLSGSEDKNVEKNCKGALFLLKRENDVKNHSTDAAGSCQVS